MQIYTGCKWAYVVSIEENVATHPLWAGSSIECERTSQPKMGPQLYSGVRESLNAGPPPPLML